MQSNKEIISGKLYIDRWYYDQPSAQPDAEGRIVVISKKSIAPLEVYQWGLTADHKCYEKYSWCENDFFSDSYYEKEISKEALIEQIETMKNLIRDTELSFWEEQYNVIIRIIGSR